MYCTSCNYRYSFLFVHSSSNLYNHSFQTEPNSTTNVFNLFNYTASLFHTILGPKCGGNNFQWRIKCYKGYCKAPRNCNIKTFENVKRCRYGNGCNNRSRCTFSHPENGRFSDNFRGSSSSSSSSSSSHKTTGANRVPIEFARTFGTNKDTSK